MTEKKHIRPAPGVLVRHPDGRRMPADGELVQMTTYWARRLQTGDVVPSLADQPPSMPRGRRRKPAAPEIPHPEE